MRTADQNPAIWDYGHLLPSSGRYPARWVDIFWNRNDDMEITEVEVVFVPRGSDVLPNGDERHAFWSAFSAYNRRWNSDLGNSLKEWLQPGGETPETIFGYLLNSGFASDAVLKNALAEFAHIEECEWARLMLRGFEDR